MAIAGKRIKVFQTGDRSAIGFEALDDSVLSIDNQVQQPTREEASSKLAQTGGCAGLVGVNVVWLFAHDMKHKKLILADYFDAGRLRSVRASKSILRHVNRITGIKVTGKIKMEDLANRIAEISHMSRWTSDGAVYRPTLKIILHLCVLSRMQHSYGNPICTFAGTYPEAGGPYLEDCRRKYQEADGRYVSAVNGIPECRGRNVAAVNRTSEDCGSTKS
jgi:hypothetical protein